MSKRANRRQRGRDRVKQSIADPMLGICVFQKYLGDRMAEASRFMELFCQWLQTSGRQISLEDLHRQNLLSAYAAARQDEERLRTIAPIPVDTGYLRSSVNFENRSSQILNTQISFGNRECTLSAYESAMRREVEQLRTISVIHQLFGVTGHEAEELNQRFCTEHYCIPSRLYELLTSNKILLHPNRRKLVEQPQEQSWIIYPASSPYHSYLESARTRILLAVNSEVFQNGVNDRMVVEIRALRELVYIEGDRLWLDETPVIGQLLEWSSENHADGFCISTLRLELPVVSISQEFEDGLDHRSSRRILTVRDRSFTAHSVVSPVTPTAPTPTAIPKPCQSCQHWHGRTYSGEYGANFLVCGMHPYGPEGDECADWEAKKASAKPVKPFVQQAIAGIDEDGEPIYVDVRTFEQ